MLFSIFFLHNFLACSAVWFTKVTPYIWLVGWLLNQEGKRDSKFLALMWVVAVSFSDLSNQGHGEDQGTEYHSCLTPLLVKLPFRNTRSLRTLRRVWRKKTLPFVKDQLEYIK